MDESLTDVHFSRDKVNKQRGKNQLGKSSRQTRPGQETKKQHTKMATTLDGKRPQQHTLKQTSQIRCQVVSLVLLEAHIGIGRG